MNTPCQSPRLEKLGHPDRTVESPEMRICKDYVAGGLDYRMIELTPVRCDHVRCNREVCRILELPHDLPAGKSILRSARVLDICDKPPHLIAELNRLFKRPCTIWVYVDSCIGEGLPESLQRFDLIGAFENPAFEFEIRNPVLLPYGRGLLHDPLRCEYLLPPEAEPWVRGAGLIDISKWSSLSLRLVRDIE